MTSPGDDVAREAVLTAYAAAAGNGLPRLDCYRAAIAAWQQSHPEASADEAHTAAVGIIVDGRLYPGMFKEFLELSPTQ
jgi:hypothetical protein